MIVLAAIIMTVSFGNVHMKQIDYRAKKNFYTDEQGLDDVYNGVGRDASAAFNKAYSDTLSAIKTNDGDDDQNKYYAHFTEHFKAYLIAEFVKGADKEAQLANLKTKLDGYVAVNDSGKKDIEVIKVGDIIYPESGSFDKLIIKDVVVKYTDRDVTGDAGTNTGFESSITTDIVIEAPYIYFFNDINAILDYSLIGNKGIFFDGQNKHRDIQGSIYAGIDSKTKNAAFEGYDYAAGVPYDGINLYKADVTFTGNPYIISKGDFNICESIIKIGPAENAGSDGSLTAAEKTAETATVNLWTGNIRTVEKKDTSASSSLAKGAYTASASTVDLNADLYVADDLELNERNSKVTFLGGNYYGYNMANNTSPTLLTDSEKAYMSSFGEFNYINSLYDSKADTKSNEHAQSSAIMVNATGTTLNIKKLTTLMLAGVSYIDIKNPSEAYKDYESSATLLDEFRTGESLAARYSQSVYLAPSSILKIKPNPYPLTGEAPTEIVNTDNLTEDNFFGVKYIDTTDPVIPVYYTIDDKTYIYYFLNFRTDSDRNKYLQEILDAKAPEEGKTSYAYNLKNRLISGAANASMNIEIIKPDNFFAATGFVAASDGTAFSDLSVTLPAVYEQSETLGKQYIKLYTRLNPASGAVDPADFSDDDFIESVTGYPTTYELPASNFVYFDKITTDTNSKLGSYKVMIRKSAEEYNGVNRDKVSRITLSDVSGIKGAIVLCNGDLIIEDGVSIDGMVIASGKIIIEGSGEIKQNRAAIQSILEQEMKKLSSVPASRAQSEEFMIYFASYYLTNTSKPRTEDNGIIIGYDSYEDVSDKITSNLYTDYVYFDNWRRGEE